jgi:glutathione S-transferase
MKIFGDSISGNCLKAKWTADLLGIDYDWIETSVLKGASRTQEYLAMNPAGQVPAVLIERNHHLDGGGQLADPGRRVRSGEDERVAVLGTI